ncbi:MAG TPA: efflux RND transporter periplasmic adaptor subunit [Anaerolineales bacterium]|nr:efflux RND transporter periplasmic adaptor subunit [Anaerolineales bacterium]
MKRIFLYIPLLLALVLTACNATAQPTPIPTVVLDSNGSGTNSPQSDEGSVTAAAVIVPVRNVELAFSTVGRVTAVDARVGERVTAGQTLITLDMSIQEARIREAEANLLAAQIQLKYNRRLGLDEVHIESSEADVASAQALVDSAKAILAAQFTLTAPFDGTIVAVDIAPSETVTPGKTVILLGDLSSYVVETTDLSERDVTHVQIGQPAVVFIEALDEEFSGQVTDVALISSTLGGDVVYKVTLALDSKPKGLLWGMSADVSIETAD